MAETRIGIIGYGKIARDQHAPAIAANSHFTLAAAVSTQATDAPVPVFPTTQAMLEAIDLDAVAICTPAGPRFDVARTCLAAGLDLLLEKPPAATLGQIDALANEVTATDRILFTTWHAQYNPAVDALKALLAREGLRTLRIEWLEDVEKWHPGQQWIWQAGGFGVFDAGINALSIASAIAPAPLLLRKAHFVPHGEAQQPAAAWLTFDAPGIEGPLTARLDWRHKGDEQWTIAGQTAAGTPFLLADGGGSLSIDGQHVATPEGTGEYPAIYARFAELIAQRRSLVNREPLRLVADAFLIASRSADDPTDFEEGQSR